MKKRKKRQTKVIVQDPSNASIFINKYLSDFQKNKISVKELNFKVFGLFQKFPIKEIISLLPPPMVNALRVFSARVEPWRESVFSNLGSFGPEVDYDLYMQWQSWEFLQTKWELHLYFKKIKNLKH